MCSSDLQQVAEIVAAFKGRGNPVLVTKTDAAAFQAVQEKTPEAEFNPLGGMIMVPLAQPADLKPGLKVVTAGTADIGAANTDLTAALSTLRSQSQAFGSNLSTVQIRQDFTKSMINTLQTGADALTLADSNEEGANLLALQTRQQLSTTALSLASQASQAVLRLFG